MYLFLIRIDFICNNSIIITYKEQIYIYKGLVNCVLKFYY